MKDGIENIVHWKNITPRERDRLQTALKCMQRKGQPFYDWGYELGYDEREKEAALFKNKLIIETPTTRDRNIFRILTNTLKEYREQASQENNTRFQIN
jgi:hypothetical protein